MTKELKCPKCGSTNVVEDDTYDTSTEVGSLTYSVCGHCEDCGVNLQWEENYIFDGSSNNWED